MKTPVLGMFQHFSNPGEFWPQLLKHWIFDALENDIFEAEDAHELNSKATKSAHRRFDKKEGLPLMVAATNVTEDSMAPMTLCTKNVSDLKCKRDISYHMDHHSMELSPPPSLGDQYQGSSDLHTSLPGIR